MKNRLAHNVMYLTGPLVVLAVAALAVLPAFLATTGIPITAPVDHTSASLAGLGASLAGALVLGGSLWWFSSRSGASTG